MKLTEQKLKEMIVQELFGLFGGKRNAEDEVNDEQGNTDNAANDDGSNNSEEGTPESTPSVLQLKEKLVALRAEIKEMERLLSSGKDKDGNKLGWSGKRALKKQIKEKTKQQTEIYKVYRVEREKEKEEEIKAREAEQQQAAQEPQQNSGEAGAEQSVGNDESSADTSEQEEEARKNKEALQRVQNILASLASQLDNLTT
jgi:hypothetical protein